jgi:transposase
MIFAESCWKPIRTAREHWEELAEQFRVSGAWARKISACFHRTGKMERPEGKPRGRQSKVTVAVDEFVKATIAARPDVTLAELQLRLWQERKLEISIGWLWHTLERLGLRLKKTLHASEQDSEAVQQRRVQWRLDMGPESVGNLIFLDESGITTEMTRHYGRAAGGRRVTEGTPGRWRTLTLLGAVSVEGWIATMTVEAPTDGEVFLPI